MVIATYQQVYLRIFKITSMKNSFIIIFFCLAIFFSCRKSSDSIDSVKSIDSVNVYVAGEEEKNGNFLVANTGRIATLSP